MNIIKDWQYILQGVNKSIEDYNAILEHEDIPHDTRGYCMSKLESKTKYKMLIEETIRRLQE